MLEYGEESFFTSKVSEHRFSKILFFGFATYVFFLLFLKPSTTVGYYFFFIILWMAIISLIPAIITEGYFLFTTNKFLWMSSFVMVFLAALCFSYY